MAEDPRPTVLVTGASGFVGSALVERLRRGHRVLALSRRPVAGADEYVRGSFASREDLAGLDPHPIDAVVHLGAVLEEGGEEETLAVNVGGTRTLLRYLVGRGCRRFVLASSIGAAGATSPGFEPRQQPIPDDHPGDATDPYGLSKWLMEEVARYFARRDPALEIALLRLGGVVDAGDRATLAAVGAEAERYPYIVGGGLISLADAAEGFARAVERPLGPGCRRINLVGATGFPTGAGSYEIERLRAAYDLHPATDWASALGSAEEEAVISQPGGRDDV
ncbi:MAG TPA: NAD(P)-dependent oxidoreductase [Solirubrobacterales bacterium]|nr:NAD(P)-dependent oxidoreductase [Solirubrobacterales bacterium]